MIISDSVEYGQLKLGHRDESLTLSIRPLLDKLVVLCQTELLDKLLLLQA